MRYDPLKDPESEDWLALNEFERSRIVRKYHRRAGISLPNENLHAQIHVVVENQLASDTPKEAHLTLLRLQKEGLDRHDAIHAIGTVVTDMIFGAMKRGKSLADPQRAYIDALNKLTAKSWLSMFDNQDEDVEEDYDDDDQEIDF